LCCVARAKTRMQSPRRRDAAAMRRYLVHIGRACIGRPCPGSKCSTGKARKRVEVFAAAMSSTVSSANRGLSLIEMTASPESKVHESSCHSVMLSSVWPAAHSTVHDDAPGIGAPSSRPPIGRRPRHNIPPRPRTPLSMSTKTKRRVDVERLTEQQRPRAQQLSRLKV
jgi:hypothetical protein